MKIIKIDTDSIIGCILRNDEFNFCDTQRE